MALMISTGYSSLMSSDEFKDNLNNAITGRYTFNGKEPKEPELYESFEYYRVVEGFVGNWFKKDKELQWFSPVQINEIIEAIGLSRS